MGEHFGWYILARRTESILGLEIPSNTLKIIQVNCLVSRPSALLSPSVWEPGCQESPNSLGFAILAGSCSTWNKSRKRIRRAFQSQVVCSTWNLE